MARHPVPRVGVRATGQVRLSPRVRHILGRRARRAAQREIGPEVRAARAAYGPIRRTYRQSVRGANQAVGLSEGLLGSQLKSLKHSGLKGQYLQQVRQELSARQSDLATSVPFLTSQARATRQSDMAAAQQNLLEARATRKKTAGQIYNSLLSTARTHGASAVKERQAAGGKGAKGKEFQQALHIAKMNYLAGVNARDSSGKPDPHYPYQDAGTWALFVKSVLGGEGVTDAGVAQRAARQALFEELNAQHTRLGNHPVSREFFSRWLRAQLRG